MESAGNGLLLLAPALGLLGQSLFAARAGVQWLASERAARSVVPRSYWWLSAAGAGLLALYAVTRRDAVLLAAPLASLLVAARNLALQRRERDARPASPRLRAPLAAALLLLVGAAVAGSLPAAGAGGPAPSAFWLGLGTAGTALWVARYPLQWWIAERLGRTALPRSFWWTSLLGASLLCAYAAARHDPIFVLAYAFSPIPCIRNLILIRRRSRRAAAPLASPSAEAAA